MHINNYNLSNKILSWYDNNKRILPWRISQNSKKEIINKINSYFGYKLISEIRLQTFSLVKKKRKENFVLNKKSKKFKEKINEIKNQDIRNSLSQLLNIAKK